METSLSHKHSPDFSITGQPEVPQAAGTRQLQSHDICAVNVKEQGKGVPELQYQLFTLQTNNLKIVWGEYSSILISGPGHPSLFIIYNRGAYVLAYILGSDVFAQLHEICHCCTALMGTSHTCTHMHIVKNLKSEAVLWSTDCINYMGSLWFSFFLVWGYS